MNQGDYTKLAKNYFHRTGYSLSVLKTLYRYAGLIPGKTVTADVGAGTGKLTENLIELGFRGFAVEPNDSMSEEGRRLLGNENFLWSKGSGEKTNLPVACVDWVLMGSSFHWTHSQQALQEFKRILKPDGFFVALWNPRDLESSPFHMDIENWIHQQVPDLKRTSSGSKQYTKDIDKTLIEGGYFKDVIFVEGSHSVEMTPERYLGAWQSVNDIRAQAGEKKFQEILDFIKDKTREKSSILVPYKTRAWIVQAT